ncbi:hypothetical protein D3C78_1122980 [compost metagenome]
MPQRAWFDFRAIDQNRDMLTGVVGARPGRVTAVVSGEDNDVFIFNQFQQLRQATVEQLQRGGIAGNVTAVAVRGVKINEVGEHNGVVAGFFHFDQGGIEQRVDTGRLDLFGDTHVSVDIGDFPDRHHFAALLVHQLFQHGWRRWLYCQVMAVTGTLEVARLVAQERTRDHAANVITAFGQFFTGDFTQLIQTVQAEGLFVTGDLEDRVGRGVENRFAGFHVLFAQLVEDHGAGRVAVAEVTRQIGALDQLVQQLLRETVVLIAEIAPVEQYRHAGNFPVA